MDQTELTAYGSMVQAIAHKIAKDHMVDGSFVDDTVSPPKNISGLYYELGESSVVETAMYYLKDLGIAVDAQKKCAGFYLVFGCDMPDVCTVAIQNHAQGPDFHGMLDHFTNFFTNFELLEVDANTVFWVSNELTGALNRLVDLGYATNSNLDYTWTDKIDPTMERLQLRDPNNQPHMRKARYVVGQLSAETVSRLDEFAKQNRKINAVKEFMDATGESLLVAKYAVEELMYQGRWK